MVGYLVEPHIDKSSFDVKPSENTKRALAKGIIVGSISLLAYVLVVVVTTPSIPAAVAIKIAFTVNSIVMIGISVGIGAQVFLSSYGRLVGCRLDKKKGLVGAGSGSSVFSSFLSFFSLVPLGCCGTWLYVLSFLPSIAGGALSTTLIQYSRPLSYIGLAIVWVFIVLSAIKLDRELKERKLINERESSGQKTKLDGNGVA